MEPKQMLEAVIEKAIENGWDLAGNPGAPYSVTSSGEMNKSLQVTEDWVPENSLVIYEMDVNRYIPQYMLFFDHKFAKAYFGEERLDAEQAPFDWVDKRTVKGPFAWAYHLQQAVLSEDPLLYYYQHLE